MLCSREDNLIKDGTISSALQRFRKNSFCSEVFSFSPKLVKLKSWTAQNYRVKYSFRNKT